MLKRVLCLALALTMTALVFASCKKEDTDDTETSDVLQSENETTPDSEETEQPEENGENTDNGDEVGDSQENGGGENQGDDGISEEGGSQGDGEGKDDNAPRPEENILTTTAKEKYFVGVTNKNAVSYAVNEEITFTVKLQADKKLASAPYFKYTLSADDGTAEEAKYAEGSSGTLTVKTKISKAGFVLLKVEACDENKNPINGVDPFQGGAGADIYNIQKTKSEPADFDTFWSGQTARLAGHEPTLLECVKWDYEKAAAGYDYYKVKISFALDGGAAWGDYVSGCLTVPKNAQAGSLNLKVVYVGAGVEDISKNYAANTATLTVAAHSMEIGREAGYYNELRNGKLSLYYENHNSTRDSVYFKEMLLRDIQALRFMKKYFAADGPSVTFSDNSAGTFAGLGNGKTTLQGGSQGGFQAIAVAALEGGVDGVTVYCPWLCDIGGNGYNGQLSSIYCPTYTDALEYYDTVNFAKRVTCRVSIASEGLGDDIVPPRGVMALYNTLVSNGNDIYVELTFNQNSTHGYTAPWGTYASYVITSNAPKVSAFDEVKEDGAAYGDIFG